MHVNVVVDDEMKVYADGKLVGTNKVWNQAKVSKIICIGNSMISTAIWRKKTCKSEFFKDHQNCTMFFSNCPRNHAMPC